MSEAGSDVAVAYQRQIHDKVISSGVAWAHPKRALGEQRNLAPLDRALRQTDLARLHAVPRQPERAREKTGASQNSELASTA